MLNLNIHSITNPSSRSQWETQGFTLPTFDLAQVGRNTQARPTWLHFGPGNIFRAFPALAQQKLLNQGLTDTGIVVCETFDEEIITRGLAPYDHLTCAVTLKNSGQIAYDIVASITEGLTLTHDKQRLIEIFTNPSLQMASFTITEKGYATHDATGQVLGYVQNELNHAPENARTVAGVVTYLAYQRFQAELKPLALVSMDNCADNGDLLKKSILFMARDWVDKGHLSQDFVAYLETLSYPISMIDKITPNPSEQVAASLSALSYQDTHIIKTSKGSTVASFVNGEESEYLFIEDDFPNGRPPLEHAGVVFTDRTTVTNVEKMKVGACLNPLHTMIAIFGSVLEYPTVSRAMADKDLVRVLEVASYQESLPFVPNPGVITPKEFLDTVLQVRFPNPFIPDMPARIATDTSLKIPVRFGEVLKTMKKQGFDVASLRAIPFFVAGWFRYLTQLNDKGERFTLSPDPMLAVLLPIFEGYHLGDRGLNTQAKGLLSNVGFFGIDLVAAGLLPKIEGYFNQLMAGEGAVGEALARFS